MKSANDKSDNVNRLLNEIATTDIKVARKKWTYEQLVASSDAVLIGRFSGKQRVEIDQNDGASHRGYKGAVPVESRFEVLAVLPPHKNWERSPKSVGVVHFVWQGEAIRLKSPELIDFSVPILRQKSVDLVTSAGIARHAVGKPVKDDSHRPFLMFLSARMDGRYQPVTGQYFPALSFRRIEE